MIVDDDLKDYTRIKIISDEVLSYPLSTDNGRKKRRIKEKVQSNLPKIISSLESLCTDTFSSVNPSPVNQPQTKPDIGTTFIR